jgi:glucokinase
MMEKISIGVDVGGSHISSAAYVWGEHRFLPETLSEHELDNQKPSDEIISIWSKTIAETLKKVKPATAKGIGFAMPGPFDYYKGIALFKGLNKKYENLYGLNIAKEIRLPLSLPESFPVRFINDATAFAIGESIAGSAAGASRCLAITLGTGFGSSFLENHIPVVSGEEVPENGMVYHLPFEKGTADDYFSTRGLLGRYFERTGKKLTGVKELAGMASGDPLAQELFHDFGLKMGIFLKPWIVKFGVEVLVIGGNISNAYPLFGESLNRSFAEDGMKVKTGISELKETASIIGSAALVNNDYYKKLKPVLLRM